MHCLSDTQRSYWFFFLWRIGTTFHEVLPRKRSANGASSERALIKYPLLKKKHFKKIVIIIGRSRICSVPRRYGVFYFDFPWTFSDREALMILLPVAGNGFFFLRHSTANHWRVAVRACTTFFGGNTVWFRSVRSVSANLRERICFVLGYGENSNFRR